MGNVHLGSRGSSCVIVLSCVFRRSNTFLRGFFVGTKFFLVWISWVRNFLSWVFRGFNFFLMANSWFKDFRLPAVWERVTENKNIEIHFKPRIHFQTGFNNCQLFIFEKCIIYYKLVTLYAAFICTNGIFRHLFSSVSGSLHSQ